MSRADEQLEFGNSKMMIGARKSLPIDPEGIRELGSLKSKYARLHILAPIKRQGMIGETLRLLQATAAVRLQ